MLNVEDLNVKPLIRVVSFKAPCDGSYEASMRYLRCSTDIEDVEVEHQRVFDPEEKCPKIVSSSIQQRQVRSLPFRELPPLKRIRTKT